MPQLVKQLRKLNTIPTEDLKKIDSDIEKLKALWIKVSVIRNKMFGHRTNNMDHDGIWEEANVTPNQFKQLIDDSKSILNDLTPLWNRSGHAFNLSATKDTVDLLEDLKNCVKRGYNLSVQMTARAELIFGHVGDLKIIRSF